MSCTGRECRLAEAKWKFKTVGLSLVCREELKSKLIRSLCRTQFGSPPEDMVQPSCKGLCKLRAWYQSLFNPAPLCGSNGDVGCL